MKMTKGSWRPREGLSYAPYVTSGKRRGWFPLPQGGTFDHTDTWGPTGRPLPRHGDHLEVRWSSLAKGQCRTQHHPAHCYCHTRTEPSSWCSVLDGSIPLMDHTGRRPSACSVSGWYTGRRTDEPLYPTVEWLCTRVPSETIQDYLRLYEGVFHLLSIHKGTYI